MRRTSTALLRHGLTKPIIVIAVLCGCLTGCAAKRTPLAVQPPAATSQQQSAEGWRYLEQDKPEAALKVFRDLSGGKDAPAEVRLGLAEALRRTSDYAKAAEQYTSLLDLEPFRLRALEGIGLTKLEDGDLAGAREVLSGVTSANASAWRAWLGLAQISDMDRDWGKADGFYASALASSDNPKLVYNNQGISMLARGRADDAAALFEKALRLDPGFEQPLINLQLANAARGPQGSSISVNTDSKLEARRLNNIGYVAMLQGRYDQAEVLLRKSLQVNPTFYPSAYRNLQIVRRLQLQATGQPAGRTETIE